MKLEIQKVVQAVSVFQLQKNCEPISNLSQSKQNLLTSSVESSIKVIIKKRKSLRSSGGKMDQIKFVITIESLKNKVSTGELKQNKMKS